LKVENWVDLRVAQKVVPTVGRWVARWVDLMVARMAAQRVGL